MMESMVLAGVILLLLNTWSHGLSVQKRHPCSEAKGYMEVYNMLKHDRCMSADILFTHLRELTTTAGHTGCRRTLEQMFADKYPRGTKIPSTCSCTGDNVLYDHGIGIPQGCRRNGLFMSLYNLFFHNGNNQPQACTTHHTVWYDLENIQRDQCEYDLVSHIAGVFSNHPVPCTCVATAPLTSHTSPATTHVATHTPQATTAAHTTSSLPANCNDLANVRVLNLFIQLGTCRSINDIWHRLENIRTEHPECMGIVDVMANHYGEPKTTDCTCSGKLIAPNPFKDASNHASFARCSNDPHYLALEQALFEGPNGCMDHTLMWYPLSLVSDHDKCRTDFIKTAAGVYRDTWSDPCSCGSSNTSMPSPIFEFLTTPKPTTTTTTSTKTSTPTTTTTTTAATTTPYVPKNYHCKKFQTVQAIANNIVVNFTSVTDCNKGGSNEGFVMEECNVTKTVHTWNKGQSIMSHCNETTWYVPVAIFLPGLTTYTPTGAQSGIFAGCLDNGFRMIVEHCDGQGPAIVHVVDDGSSPLKDPSQYYIIS